MVMEIRKTETKEVTNKTKRNGTKMKKNMNLKEVKKIMIEDVNKEIRETMKMTKKIPEVVQGRVVKGEENKTKWTKTDPE